MKKNNVLTVLYIIVKLFNCITIVLCACTLGFTKCDNPEIFALLIIAIYILDNLTSPRQ